jgi:pimeloyl-ACP methyl ester carboxylesterase
MMRLFQSRFRFLLIPLVAAVLIGGYLVFSFTTQAHADSLTSSGVGACHSYNIGNIALASGQPANNTIYGQLCFPAKGPTHTVMFLIHGGTYDHTYWDWPQNPSLYSGVRYFTASGYTTFNIDRIGIGNSSHPNPGSSITIDVNGYVLHQLVGMLRAGSIGGFRFGHVELVGHSVGSYSAIDEAANFHDVDAVVLTGYAHTLSPGGVGALMASFIPANQDPSGRFSSLDATYLTTSPGTRAAAFYFEPGTYSDPNVISFDEQTKQTVTAGELSTLSVITASTTQQISVPVLEIVGQEDSLNCGTGGTDCSSNAAFYQAEAPDFSSAAHLQAVTIPNTGHDLNLHPTAPITYATIIGWTKAHFAANV